MFTPETNQKVLTSIWQSWKHSPLHSISWLLWPLLVCLFDVVKKICFFLPVISSKPLVSNCAFLSAIDCWIFKAFSCWTKLVLSEDNHLIGTKGFVLHKQSVARQGEASFRCVEITKATRECVAVKPICVHFWTPLQKWFWVYLCIGQKFYYLELPNSKVGSSRKYWCPSESLNVFSSIFHISNIFVGLLVYLKSRSRILFIAALNLELLLERLKAKIHWSSNKIW